MKNEAFLKLKIQNLFLLTFVLILALSPALVLAICTGPLVPCGGEGNPCEFCHIFVLINNVISFSLTCLAPLVAVLLLVFGGFYLLTAGPDPEKVKKARSIIFSAVIGLVIIFVAWVFLNTFLDFIGVVEWTGLKTWWQIQCP